ncbi:MAG: PDZ domain-containing protein [Cocleimonas sp.]|nr:PDZ domain-containing protein [Cocleimonas sp.]
MSLFYRLIILLALSSLAGAAMADSAQRKPSQETQLKHFNTYAYMGVRVDLLPKAMLAQLPEDVLVGQGIMVSGFGKKSPAEQQGLKRFDVLLTYDRHALMHPKKFITLIRNDKPRRVVQLKLVRQGKIMILPVTLTAQKHPLNEDQLDYQYNLQTQGYDGMKVKQFAKDDFKASIRYLAADGVVRSRTFAGTYKKIQRDIYAASDLSMMAKQHLMQAITKRKKNEDGWFGDIMPFTDGDFFNF